jgi:hypothetical protein
VGRPGARNQLPVGGHYRGCMDSYSYVKSIFLLPVLYYYYSRDMYKYLVRKHGLRPDNAGPFSTVDTAGDWLKFCLDYNLFYFLFGATAPSGPGAPNSRGF